MAVCQTFSMPPTALLAMMQIIDLRVLIHQGDLRISCQHRREDSSALDNKPLQSGHPLGNELSGGDFLLILNDAKSAMHGLDMAHLNGVGEPRRMLNGCWRPCETGTCRKTIGIRPCVGKRWRSCGDDSDEPASPWR